MPNFAKNSALRPSKIVLAVLLFIAAVSCQNIEVSEPHSSGYLHTATFNNLPSNKKLVYIDSIYQSLSSASNSPELRQMLLDISAQYYYLNKQKKSQLINYKVLELASDASDNFSKAEASYYIGDNFEPYRKDSAYHYYLQAEKLYQLSNREQDVARMKFNKAVILFYEGNYIESEVELTSALKILVQNEDKKLLFASYNLMGSNFEKLEDYDNAMKYYLLSQNLLKSMPIKDTYDHQSNYIIASAVNIANIYEKTGQYSKAIGVLEEILDKDLEQKWPRTYAVVLGNLGYAKLKRGNLVGVENLLLKSLELTKKYDRPSELLYKLNNLGEYYAVIGDTLQSTYYLKQALKISENSRAGEGFKSTLRLLSKIDYANASSYKEKYITHSDSLVKKQRQNRNRFARIEYETDRIEGQNKVLSNKNLKIISISFITVSVLLGLLILRYISSQKRESKILAEKQQADQELSNLLKQHQMQVASTRIEEQKRISKELHDGIMNQIYGARLNLEMLNDENDENSKAKRRKFIQAFQDIEKEIRLISHDLQKDNVQNGNDYIALLMDFIEQQNAIGTTQITLQNDPIIEWEKISGLVKINVKRIIQEAILNMSKSAQASNCWVIFVKSEDKISLTIQDNGVGFDASHISNGIGLKNMKSRAKLINANLKIESVVNYGTTIKLIFSTSST